MHYEMFYTHTQTHCSYMDPDAVSNRIQELDNTLAAMFSLLVWELVHQTIHCIGYFTLEIWIVMWTNVRVVIWYKHECPGW